MGTNAAPDRPVADAPSSPRRARLALGACVVAAALVAAGCGARGGPGIYLGLSAPPGTELAVGQAATGAGGGRPAQSVPNTVQAGNTVAFCLDVEAMLTLYPRLVQLSGRSGTTIQAIKDLDTRFEMDAPSDILPDVSLVVQTNRRIVGDLTASPIDINDLAEAIQSPGYQLAIQQVSSYGISHCQGG